MTKIFCRSGLNLVPLILPLALLASVCQANPGQLDPTFGQGGKATTDFGYLDRPGGMALTSTQHIVVGGSTDNPISGTQALPALCRYKPDGTLDPSFGTDGKVILDMTPWNHIADVAIQNDDKIVAALASHDNLTLLRLKPNGSLDSDFGTAGKTTLSSRIKYFPTSLLLQADGKILVTARATGGLTLARFTSDGILDPTFADNGIYSGPGEAYAMALQKDGKILVSGSNNSQLAVWRFTASGELDTTFNQTGVFTASYVSYPNASVGEAIAVDADGSIVAGGTAGQNQYIFLVKLNSDGTL